MTSAEQKERRRLSAYASNDNRVSFDYLKAISLGLVVLAILIAIAVWLQAFRPIEEGSESPFIGDTNLTISDEGL